MNAREVWITGAGLVSSLGEGLDAHWRAAVAGDAPKIDADSFAPVTVHPMPAMEWSRQIPKKVDQNQMENWQRIGTYAAGLALDDAGLKGDAERLATTQMVVAAGGGERNVEVDDAISTGLRKTDDKGRFLNERLMNDLKPTLFLAQLSNLLAGNIAIVHGVVGASRTFMGEEQAGVDAVRIAHARIAAGQGDVFIVGGSYASQRPDMHLMYEFKGHNRKGPWVPVFERDGASAGFDLGAMGAFMVLEEAGTAKARGRKPYAKLTTVVSDRTRRDPGDAAASLRHLWETIAPKLKSGRFTVLSGSSGARGVTREERDALAALAPSAPARAIGNLIGHGMEAQFPAAVLLAAMVLEHGGLFPPAKNSPTETAFDGGIDQVVVTGLGHWRGEGLALVERV
ncbi:MAG: beta-ketoacyl-ACP synthase II [Rhizobiales bacterium 65-9]|nr:beta-ketoacyl-ACP synthase [Hyphomicrobiales bacterium]OJY37675.1 MAG: beta-ketoacyl-ACP synthase II [Rhizobiales bacterium 65-9]